MILDDILKATRQRIAEAKRQTPLDMLKDSVVRSKPARDFRGALDSPGIKLIAEVKRASPSKGVLRADLDVKGLVRCYSQYAVAISVLTEPTFFKGSLADLVEVREMVDLPLLCKDFLLDPYQVYEARQAGADCILLIAAALSQTQLEDLMGLARRLGMAALVEVHDEEEMKTAVAVGANLVGINSRNLRDFTTDLDLTSKLAPLAPPGAILVSESGIKSRADVLSLQKAGAKAVLVGETLVISTDPEVKIRELMGS